MGWRCSTACSFGLLCVLKGYGAGPVLTLCGLVGLGEHRTGKLDNKGIQLDFMDAGLLSATHESLANCFEAHSTNLQQ